jgi:NAD(P)-dependent dehydrogenase (short-subunit alcohol dehydrogenase family)
MKRTVLVTGANRGIGLAIARQLAVRGNFVLLGSRDLKAGEEAAQSLRSQGLEVEPIRLNLASQSSIGSAINEIAKAGRHPDVLVNNAGVLHQKPLLELTDDEIAESLAVHLTGPLRLVRALVPIWLRAITAGSSMSHPDGVRSLKDLAARAPMA